MSASLENTALYAEPYISVTAAGCYHAVEHQTPTVTRVLLQQILSNPDAPALSHYTGEDTDSIAQLENAGFITLDGPRQSLPEGNLSKLLPHVLPALSERQRVVLAESQQGLYLDYCGVSKAQAEELAVLAASLGELAERRNMLLGNQLSINSRAFGMVDPAGNSEIGFWPLHIANNTFTLIVMGIPCFNTVQFCTLVWVLIERYGPHHRT